MSDKDIRLFLLRISGSGTEKTIAEQQLLC
jgi:hypothetical protein